MKFFANHRRVLALGLVVLVTAILFLSSLFVITHVKHECTGEDCPICGQIRACIHAIHLLTEAVGTAVVILFGYLSVKNKKIMYLVGLFLLPASLVRLKIRMDN